MTDYEDGYENGRDDFKVKAVKLRREGYDVMLPILEDNWGHVVVAGLPWAKLTVREIEWCFDDANNDLIGAARNIEFKLKEKNT